MGPTSGGMERKIILPRLQAWLDRLPVAQSLALARMKRFASGHNCIIAHANSGVVFQKMPQQIPGSTGG